MHFFAATDCQYRLKKFATKAQSHSMDMQVAIASAICVMYAIGIGIHVFIADWRNRKQNTRSQQITLAWICFDKNGRLAVTSEGVLPSRKITHKYPSHDLGEEFDTGNSAFQWLYRVSRTWGSVSGLIVEMRSHVRAYRKNRGIDTPPGSSRSSAIYDEDTYSDSIVLFKEKALVAAASLASLVSLPLESLGVLADKIFETGTLGPDNGSNGHKFTVDDRTDSELEAGVRRPVLFGKGKVLFITKEVSEVESTQLLNAGLRLATIQQVKQTIANAMRIDVPALESHISGLKRYTENLQMAEKSGTYLSFFAMLPKPHGQGFDIVVKKSNQDQLPDVQLLDAQPQDWQQALFNKLDGEKVPEVLQLLQDRTGKLGTLLDRDLQFVAKLQQVIVQLTAPFPLEWVREARFRSKRLKAHYSHSVRAVAAATTIYAFTVIGDVHGSIDGSEALARIPRSFFDARHRVYPGSPDHAILAQEVRSTFNPIFAKRQRRQDTSGRYNLPKLSVSVSSIPMRSLKKKSTSFLRPKSSHGSISPPNTPVIPETFELRGPLSPVSTFSGLSRSSGESNAQRASTPVSANNLGGILVRRDTTVKVDNRSDVLRETPRQVDSPVGKKATPITDKPEITFVDDLTTITKERFKPAFNAALH